MFALSTGVPTMGVAMLDQPAPHVTPRKERERLAEYLKWEIPPKEDQAMPKLVSIAVEHKDFYVAVDEDGQVWTGSLKRSSEGGSFYIEWKPLGSKFPKEGDR
jgi:hypothetical protein